MVKIYTRRGDGGFSKLKGGQSFSKASALLQAFGQIDELNVALGLVKTALSDQKEKNTIHLLQETLFKIASTLAGFEVEIDYRKIEEFLFLKTKWLEDNIDSIEEKIGPLNRFIFPGKGELSTRWHMARVICRRMERNIIKLNEESSVSSCILKYINRLSDWLFMKARESEE